MLVALRIFNYLTVALRYKLRMFGFILEGPVYVFCDSRGEHEYSVGGTLQETKYN